MEVKDVFAPSPVERITVTITGGHTKTSEEPLAAGALIYVDGTACGEGDLPPWRIDGWLVEERTNGDDYMSVDMEVTLADFERINGWRVDNGFDALTA